MRKLLLAIAVSLLPALAVPQTVTQQWAIQQVPAAATQATISRAAVAGRRHVATSVTVCVSAGAAQGALAFNLRNGASGAGTVLWSALLSASAGQSMCVALPVNIAGSTNTAMTLESAAAPAASNFATVALTGYDTY